MSYIIQTSRLTKAYKGTEVVSNVNMHIKKGEIYGFLGPNGAGKTTVMRMLTNLIKPTAGDIQLFGEPLLPNSYETLKRMGSIIEFPIFYDKLTAVENLELHCRYMGYYRKNAVAEALERVSLEGIAGKQVKEFSLGMKQRLGIARAIVTRPELLLLDEPINGLDPVGIREMRTLLDSLSKEYGMTLLISSHILGEIEQIADTIGVLDKGRLVQEVSMNVVRLMNANYTELITPDVKKAAFVLENELAISNFKVSGERELRIYDAGMSSSELSKKLILHDVPLESITVKANSLEDYFLELLEGGKKHA
jgi:ABC-2 type transport system ATP-binding protein